MSGAGILLGVTYGSTELKSLKVASCSTLKEEKQTLSQTIQTVDKLYGENKMKEALAYLERNSDNTEPEILWRLARLCYKVSWE